MAEVEFEDVTVLCGCSQPDACSETISKNRTARAEPETESQIKSDSDEGAVPRSSVPRRDLVGLEVAPSSSRYVLDIFGEVMLEAVVYFLPGRVPETIPEPRNIVFVRVALGNIIHILQPTCLCVW